MSDEAIVMKKERDALSELEALRGVVSALTVAEWNYQDDDGYDLCDALEWLAGLEKKRCPAHEKIFEAASIGKRFAPPLRAALDALAASPRPCSSCKGQGFFGHVTTGGSGDTGWGNATTLACSRCGGSGLELPPSTDKPEEL